MENLKNPSAFLSHLARRGAGSIHPLGRLGTEIMVQTVAVDRTQKILELGCGTGETLVRMADAGGVCVSGLDISSAMTECAHRRSVFCGMRDRVEIQCVPERTQWPFEDGSFDLVYAESVLAILERETRMRVFGEIQRVLKEDGRFIFSDAIWRSGTPHDVVLRANSQCEATFGIPQATDDWIGPGACERELVEAGFREVSAKSLMEIRGQICGSDTWNSEAARKSRWFTFRQRCRAMLSPVFVIDEIKFSMACYRLRGVGQSIEPWLFQSRNLLKS